MKVSLGGQIILVTSDGAELPFDKQLLCRHSHVLADLLGCCAGTDRLKVDEAAAQLRPVLTVMRGEPLAGTYNTKAFACWDEYRGVLQIAHEYDMAAVKERCEKYLVSRWYLARETGKLLAGGNWAQLLQECLGKLDATTVPVGMMQALLKSVCKEHQRQPQDKQLQGFARLQLLLRQPIP
ncbi:hypothetical protein GPECTOR_34g730 [Gonium pectorale]|uniref:BTB domain-containing protein n=1 Tax=Gonium pectorale TaxID=33097 RepID=A0A150GCI9_GONPE|nr:hypothetical protein GPECTOR_34g730 [Gonium pectorale]|eukprot:KXZ47571.1 hypothetical protein GPECTOR_34g730 [Gonium pectorale]